MAEWLPGMLPPDAGRLERAARRYAIAVLSRHCVLRMPAHKEGHAANALEECCSAMDLIEESMRYVRRFGYHGETTYEPGARLLRARVTLWLRWCERVERSEAERGLNWAMEWATPDDPRAWVGHFGPVRWAQPLWTQAPAHDPSVTAADRRATKQQRKV